MEGARRSGSKIGSRYISYALELFLILGFVSIFLSNYHDLFSIF